MQTTALSLVCAALALTAPPPPQVFKEVIETGIAAQPAITMFLRLPPGCDKRHPPTGLVAFCSWQKDPDALRKKLGGNDDPLVRFAMDRNLAVMTWDTARVWRGGTSHNDLTKAQTRAFDERFEDIARAWEKGLERFARKQGVPEDGILLHGISGGAHWAQRLALRKPHRFLAASIHVANSYDAPTPEASRVLWLISSGEFDGGLAASRRFYREALAAKYPIVFKMGPGLGHADRADMGGFRTAFFDYALGLRDACAAGTAVGGTTPYEIMRSGIENAQYFGDAFNESILSGPLVATIPPAQRVPLPDARLATRWQKLLTPKR